VSYAHTGPAPKLEHSAASQIVRIVQEALQNVEKHAAASEVIVRSEMRGDELRVSVVDDGTGFDSDEVTADVKQCSGFGLVSLRERARLAGGTVQVESAPGKGTRVTVTVPEVE
jgi:two-component system sensor histidine kinase DegS